MSLNIRFIQMCEAAEELQKAWNPEKGDIVIFKQNIEFDKERVFNIRNWAGVIIEVARDRRSAIVQILDAGECVKVKRPDLGWYEVFTWIPTQEQLQRMIDRNHTTEDDVKVSVEEVKALVPEGYPVPREEVWLRVVMRKRYGKVWVPGLWR